MPAVAVTPAAMFRRVNQLVAAKRQVADVRLSPHVGAKHLRVVVLLNQRVVAKLRLAVALLNQLAVAKRPHATLVVTLVRRRSVAAACCRNSSLAARDVTRDAARDVTAVVTAVVHLRASRLVAAKLRLADVLLLHRLAVAKHLRVTAAATHAARSEFVFSTSCSAT